MRTPQAKEWTGKFGREYTTRNSLTLPELDSLYERNYGVTRSELNHRFLNGIPLNARILEVGCNIGNQLLLLNKMGYSDLFGIELQHDALIVARGQHQNVHLVEASALEIPFADGSFDVIFTSGVLIHIAPPHLLAAMAEIHRCTRDYIWGLEYYAPESAKVQYRGQDDLLWKMDYKKLYLERFADLELSRCERLSYREDDNEDRMFLLRKKREDMAGFPRNA
jgi:pseudaminic acid biosynthesis-associated methylase